MKRLGLLFCTLALLSLSLLPLILNAEKIRFARQEPFYGAPVPAPSGNLFIRNDAYGKGFFTASRNGGRQHKGVDFIAAYGAPVYAAKSGRITVSTQEKGYGDWIEVLHPDGLRSRYAHLSGRVRREGDWVDKNMLIGYVGKSGNAGNPKMICHLHFEIRKEEGVLNPSSNLLDRNLVVTNKIS